MGHSKDMNFKVPPFFHREFKIYAAKCGMMMNELLFACFDYYVKNHPIHP